MDRPKAGKRVVLLVAGGVLALALIAACYRAGQGSPIPWAGQGAGAPDRFAGGKQVFAASCARCHSVGSAASAGPRDGMKGPDLAGVGADPHHTRQWFINYIRDPQAEDRVSRMPKFEGKLSEGDLLALADYLASLRAD